MSVHKQTDRSGLYFITFTCYDWLPLFEVTNTYNEVYNFFDILVKAGHSIVGYTIMPNHVHLLMYFKKNKQSLNTVIGNGKRFVGYEIIKQLKERNNDDVLNKLKSGVTDAERERKKQHQVWQGTFDVKECWREGFILQKLNYMHANPCAERWQLCATPCDYAHSSAAFYEAGKRDNKWLQDYRDFLALLLEQEEEERRQQEHQAQNR